jgi:hypothetical protein
MKKYLTTNFIIRITNLPLLSKESEQAEHATPTKVTTLWSGLTGKDHLGGHNTITLE